MSPKWISASAAGAALCALLASATASAQAGSCESELRIEGSPDDARSLREALRAGSLGGASGGSCAGALVSLRERDGGYTVALALGGAKVEREVGSIGAAATWVEVWLTGPMPDPLSRDPSTPASQAAPARALAPAPDRAEPAPAPPPRVILVQPAAQVALFGTGGAGSDASMWAGGELSARLHMTPSFWMGAAFGAESDSTWTGPAQEIDETQRVALRASARAGGRWPLSPRVDGVLGAGVGVTWGSTMREQANDDMDTDQGGLVLEAHADASVRLSGRFSLLGGLCARGRLLSRRSVEEAEEAVLPDPMPALTGEVRLGAGWDVGGSP